MDSFDIENYKVRVEIRRSGDPVRTSRNRIIELESPRMAHGIVMRGLLSFSTQFNSWTGTPASGFYSDHDPSRPRVTGWLPTGEFAQWYDLLRSESPVRLMYNITPINGAKYINQIGLGTSEEPVGEGPSDVDA